LGELRRISDTQEIISAPSENIWRAEKNLSSREDNLGHSENIWRAEKNLSSREDLES
jgi:hypothetical protein